MSAQNQIKQVMEIQDAMNGASSPSFSKQLESAELKQEASLTLDSAANIVCTIKDTAALFGAFAFSQFGSALPDGTSIYLRELFVIFVTSTLGLELLSVFVCVQLLYRMNDGTFDIEKLMRESKEATNPMGILVTEYAVEFNTIRGCFLGGLGCMLLSTLVKGYASLETYEAVWATVVLFACATPMAWFSMRSQKLVFNRIKAEVEHH